MANKQLSRAVAHDAACVPGELALCCINESSLYARHVDAALKDTGATTASSYIAAMRYLDCAADMARTLNRKFGDAYTSTDILAAAVELSVYYRARLAESE